MVKDLGFIKPNTSVGKGALYITLLLLRVIIDHTYLGEIHVTNAVDITSLNDLLSW
jgi:hypothetical protein